MAKLLLSSLAQAPDEYDPDTLQSILREIELALQSKDFPQQVESTDNARSIAWFLGQMSTFYKNAKVDLHVTSEHTVNNTNITPEVKSIFNSTILNNAAIRISKLKDDTSTGTAYEETLAWTSTGVSVNSDDTIIYNWDTAGEEVGTYELQVSSTFLNQNIMGDKVNLIVR